MKKLIVLLTLLVTVNISFGQLNQDISNEHNEMCLKVIRESGVKASLSFQENQDLVLSYLNEWYGVKLNKLDEKLHTDPYLLLDAAKPYISPKLYDSTKNLLKITEGKKTNDVQKIIENELKNIGSKGLNKQDQESYINMASIFHGSLSFWQSNEVISAMEKQGFNSKNGNSKLNNVYFEDFQVKEDDYWKIAAADGVGAVAGGLLGFGIGAVIGAIAESSTMAIGLW